MSAWNFRVQSCVRSSHLYEYSRVSCPCGRVMFRTIFRCTDDWSALRLLFYTELISDESMSHREETNVRMKWANVSIYKIELPQMRRMFAMDRSCKRLLGWKCIIVLIILLQFRKSSSLRPLVPKRLEANRARDKPLSTVAVLEGVGRAWREITDAVVGRLWRKTRMSENRTHGSVVLDRHFEQKMVSLCRKAFA